MEINPGIQNINGLQFNVEPVKLKAEIKTDKSEIPQGQGDAFVPCDDSHVTGMEINGLSFGNEKVVSMRISGYQQKSDFNGTPIAAKRIEVTDNDGFNSLVAGPNSEGIMSIFNNTDDVVSSSMGGVGITLPTIVLSKTCTKAFQQQLAMLFGKIGSDRDLKQNGISHVEITSTSTGKGLNQVDKTTIELTYGPENKKWRISGEEKPNRRGGEPVKISGNDLRPVKDETVMYVPEGDEAEIVQEKTAKKVNEKREDASTSRPKSVEQGKSLEEIEAGNLLAEQMIKGDEELRRRKFGPQPNWGDRLTPQQLEDLLNPIRRF
jgi:hypothetical protein